MPNGLNNWTFKDVVSFLKQHFFIFSHSRGSHHYYKGYVNKSEKSPWIPKHGSKSIPIRSLECCIHKSGIPKDFWKRWATSTNKSEIQYEGAEDWPNE